MGVYTTDSRRTGSRSGGKFSTAVAGNKRTLTRIKGGKNSKGSPAKPQNSATRHAQSGYRTSQPRLNHATNTAPSVGHTPPRLTSWAQPAAAKPAIPKANLFDATYFAEKNALDTDYGARIARLKGDGTNQTPFQVLMDRLGRDNASDLYGNNAQLASRGIFQSGATRQFAERQATDFQDKREQLRREFGDYAIQDLQNAQLRESEALAGASMQRQQDNDLLNQAFTPSALGPAKQMPGAFAPKGWKRGQSGWFRANNKWNFVNAEGYTQAGVKAPKAGARTY